jgi:hypothetical protein
MKDINYGGVPDHWKNHPRGDRTTADELKAVPPVDER